MEGSAKKPANPPSAQVSKGGKTGDKDPVCEKLEVARDAEDDRIKKEIAAKKARRKPHERRDYFKKRKQRQRTQALNAHKATTVSSMFARCGGKDTRKTGYSSHSRLSAKGRKGMAEGIKKGEPSNMCKKKGKEFEHAEKGRTSSCQHTEGRFIEDQFKEHATPAGRVSNCTVSMSIKWKQRTADSMGRYKETEPLDKPCGDCEKTICHAIYCGMKILICKEDGQRHEPDCSKHN